MTSYIDKVANALQQLKSLGDSKNTLDQRDKLITKMRVDLTFFENLPPSTTLNNKECILAREVYEHATFLAVEKEDIQQFERYFKIVRAYYDEFEGVLPES